MSSTTDKPTGWRGSREIWLETAKEAFVENGVDAVKIQPLARRLNLSRTSFYWFFEDRGALLDALLDDWDTKNTGGLIAACEAYADSTAEALLNLIGAFLDQATFDARLDFAVRGWALQSDTVMERVRGADERRLATIRSLFARHGFDVAEAGIRARTVYLTQIGYISMQVRESLAMRMERIPGYVALYSGQMPSARELSRFHARHGFRPPSDTPPRT